MSRVGSTPTFGTIFLHASRGLRSDLAGEALEFGFDLHQGDAFVLVEPARTVIAVAAFTGLRESEIRGLRWEDYTGDELHIRRSIWHTHVDATKTPESKNAVPVIAPLRKILDNHRRSTNGTGSWIFTGAKKRFSLHLDNLSRREIAPVLGPRWKGWHAFRRGLATNLFSLGVPAEVA